MEFSDKLIVVFGGTGLIGRALVAALVAEGARVRVAGRRSSDAARKVFGPETADRLAYEVADVSDPDAVARVLDRAFDAEGRIDAVVNATWPRNDGFGAKFEEVRYPDFAANLLDHVGGAFLVSQNALRLFDRQGHGTLLLFGSVYGTMTPRFELYEGTGMTKEVEYSLAKAAIVMLTKYLAAYAKGRNIRVNCLSPGGLLAGQPQEFRDRYTARCAGKGMLDPEDVVGAALFLLSEESRFVTGENLIVDDGFVL